MKWLCSILALLILVLSVQPACADLSSAGAAVCSSNCCNETEQQEEEQGEQDNCAYGCNPFQVCGCCAFSVITPQFSLPAGPPPLPRIMEAAGSRLSSFLPDQLIAGIWQPPRSASA